MNGLMRSLEQMFDEAESVFSHFDVKTAFMVEDRTRKGCNTDLRVLFNYDNCEHIEFTWQPSAESADAFVNRIKAFMFDVIELVMLRDVVDVLKSNKGVKVNDAE